MGKIVVKGVLLVALFLGMWFGLSQINWMKGFRVEKVGSCLSKELGDVYWNYFKGLDEEVHDSTVVQHLDSLLNRICTANGIDTASVKLHVLSDSTINAFSLPDRHIVIYTGLLDHARTDAQAVRYMINAKIDPDGLAQLLERLDQLQSSGINLPSWISTHPDNAERIENIRFLAKNDLKNFPQQ